MLVLMTLLSGIAGAQVPDLRAKLDLALSFDYRDANTESARLYTPLGHPSTASLTAKLDQGYNIYVAERLGRLPHDSAEDILDEAYFEDPGIFRVGKQYVPFGTGRLLHDSVNAFRIDSNLIAEDLPVSLVAASDGAGRTQGFILRAGRSLGLSAAVGQHFGIDATSLGVVRHPEDAPGRDGGWKQAFGGDATRRFGKLTLSAEIAAFAGGPEPDLTVFDAEGTFVSDGYHTIGLGYSHSEDHGGHDYFRVFGTLRAAKNLDLEPLVRLRDGGLYDAAVTLRLRF